MITNCEHQAWPWPPGPDTDRLVAKLAVRPRGCIEFMGGRKGGNYGAFWYKGRLDSAHRVSLLLLGVPIPKGMEVDHLCKSPPCVNPDHLEVVTRAENNRRSDSWSAKKLRQTHCKRGHAFDEKNTYRDKNGRRRCRACHAARVSRQYWANKAAAS